MREYTGDRVFQPLRGGYASRPSVAGIPIEPDLEYYTRGVVPLDSLPAPYWNWFFSSISNNDNRVAPALADIYAELDAILVEAGISPDETSHSQILQSIQNIIANSVTPVESRIDDIEGKIPSQADANNQLADKDFVNSTVNNLAARYITPTSSGDVGWSSLEDIRAGPWYSGGQTVTPSQNDYAIFTNTDNSIWRASFSGGQWSSVFKINDTPFTEVQNKAINSGITTALTDKITPVSKTTDGLCPQLPDETTATKYLRQDGTWQIPPDNDTTYSEMTDTTLGLVRLNGNYTFTGIINVPTPAMPS
jgi:hypothetical protein